MLSDYGSAVLLKMQCDEYNELHFITSCTFQLKFICVCLKKGETFATCKLNHSLYEFKLIQDLCGKANWIKYKIDAFIQRSTNYYSNFWKI